MQKEHGSMLRFGYTSHSSASVRCSHTYYDHTLGVVLVKIPVEKEVYQLAVGQIRFEGTVLT